MLPGFSALSILSNAGAPVALAGPWDSPKECRPLGTDTFCTGLVMWCTDVYACPGNSSFVWHDQIFFGRQDNHTPYPCGACFGITSPDDW